MINFNGNITSDTNVISNTNRGYAYGDALFETIKVSHGKLLFWEDHYFRLMASMRIMRMEIPMSFTMEFLEEEIGKLLKANSLFDASTRVKLMVHRNEGGFYFEEKFGAQLVKSLSWQGIHSACREKVDKTRFTSFCRKATDPLLWAHYAGGFGGVVIEYEFPVDQAYDIRPMGYEGTPILTEEQVNQVIAGRRQLQDYDVLLSKDAYWRYEDEYRLFQDAGTNGSYIDDIKPTKVVLGYKDSAVRPVLEKIAKQFGVPCSWLIQRSETGKFQVYDEPTEIDNPIPLTIST